MSAATYKPSPADLPDLHNYSTYQAWLQRVLDRIGNTQGLGAVAALARRIGFAQAQLRNIAARRRRLRSPYLERLAEALALPEPQARLLALKVALAHARGEANKTAARRALEAFELEQGRPRLEAVPGSDGPVLGTILQALSGTRFWMEAQGLSEAIWPPVTAGDIKRVCVAAQGGGAGAFGPVRRDLHPPGPGEILWAEDVLRCARLALATLPLGLRLLRSSIWLVPDQGWPPALAVHTERFQNETAAWARGLRAARGACQVMGVYLQDTPLTASVAGSGPAWTDGALRAESAPSTRRPEGVSTPSMVETSQTHPVSFGFDDYRDFLNATLAAKRARVRPGLPAYTNSQLARKLGCRTGTLGNVLTKRRHLPQKYVEALITALHLSPKEAEDFKLAMQYTMSRSPIERGYLVRARMETPAFREARPMGAAAMACLSELVHCCVLELAGHPQFRADPDWLASVLTVPCTSAQAQKALDDLQKVGALAVDAEGNLRPTGDYGWLPGGKNPDLSFAHHRSNLMQAQSALRRSPESTRQAGQVIVLPVSEVPELIERVRTFQAGMDALCAEAQRTAQPESWSVRLLTVQLFQGSVPLHSRL